MAIKQPLKNSEARIIILLSQVDDQYKYTGAISAKLDMDYSYTIHILDVMTEKGWLKMTTNGVKRYYFVRSAAPKEEAKRLLERKG